MIYDHREYTLWMDLHLVSCHMTMLLHWIAIILHLAPGVLNCNDDPPPPCCPDKDDVRSPCCNDEAGEYCCIYQVTWEIPTLFNMTLQSLHISQERVPNKC